MKNKEKILTGIILILSIVITLIGLSSYTHNKDSSYIKANVTSITEEQLQEDPVTPGLFLGFQQIQVQLLEGDHKDEIYHLRNPLSRLYNVHTKVGMKIILKLDYKDEKLANISVFNYDRSHVIYILGFTFFIALIIFGRVNGFKAVISLMFTGVMIIFVMLPLIFNGFNPIFSAIITISIITILSLLLISGTNKKTLAAILGTIIGVTCAGIISSLAGKAAYLSGLTMSEAEELIYISENTSLQVRGLMFTTILIASLGAIMDVAMSISSSIYEINSIDERLTKKELLKSGMNVGKDVMGTMSNTLILAFAGGSLNTMILIMAYKMPYTQLMNLDLIATEFIQGLAGSIGIVLTVPITSLIAASLLKSGKSAR